MNYLDIYYYAVIVNCITILHLSMNRIDKHHDRTIFYAVVSLTIARLCMDIVCRHSPDKYVIILGAFVGMELILLDCVMRKMRKFASSPPIVIFFMSLCMLVADISYGLHFLQLLQVSEAAPADQTGAAD